MNGQTDDAALVARLAQRYGQGQPPQGLPAAPQASPQAAPDLGYGPGVRSPDASSGRGIDVWVGSDQLAAQPSEHPAAGNGQGPPQAPAPPPSQDPSSPPRAPGAHDPGKWSPGSLADGVIGALARGVPILGSWADEADAATNALAAPVIEPAMRSLERMGMPTGYDERFRLDNVGSPGLDGFGDRYRAAALMQHNGDQRFDAEHPALSTAGKIVGGVAGAVATLPALAAGTGALPAAAGLLPRMAAGAAEGGAVGYLHGTGEGTGGFTDPSRQAAGRVGALVGAGAGGAFPLAAKGLGVAWDATGAKAIDALMPNRTIIPPAAPVSPQAALATAIRRTGSDVARSADGAVTTRSSNADLADVIARRSREDGLSVSQRDLGQATSYLARALERQGMTPAQAVQRMDELGPGAILADTGEATRDALKTATNIPGPSSQLARAVLNARQEGVLEGGHYVARPSSVRVLDAGEEGMGLSGRQYHSEMDSILAGRKAAADPLYAKVREAPPVDIGEFRDFAGSPDFRTAYDRARQISQREFVALPDGSRQIQPLPERFSSNEGMDWRTLDLMKQGLDDMVTEGKTQGIGSNTNKSIKDFRNAFRDKLDSLNPDYKAARQAYSGPTAMHEALEEGRSALREDAPALAQRFSAMSEGEQQMYRLGALQALKDKLGNTDVTYDAARTAGLLKPNQLERFREIFPDQRAFASFVGRLENERTMFQTRAAVQGNSTTAKQLEHLADGDRNAARAAQVAGAVTSGPLASVGALASAIMRMGGERKLTEGGAAATAGLLTRGREGLGHLETQIGAAQAKGRLGTELRHLLGALTTQGAVKMGTPAQ